MNDLENTVAALKSEFQKTLNDKTENQKSLEENLATAKHDLLRVQEQLSMAEKVRLVRVCLPKWGGGGAEGDAGGQLRIYLVFSQGVSQCVLEINHFWALRESSVFGTKLSVVIKKCPLLPLVW